MEILRSLFPEVHATSESLLITSLCSRLYSYKFMIIRLNQIILRGMNYTMPSLSGSTFKAQLLPDFFASNSYVYAQKPELKVSKPRESNQTNFVKGRPKITQFLESNLLKLSQRL